MCSRGAWDAPGYLLHVTGRIQGKYRVGAVMSEIVDVLKCSQLGGGVTLDGQH